MKDLWFLGDATLKEGFEEYNTLCKKLKMANIEQPYIHHHYNVHNLHQNPSGNNGSTLARINNALVNELNDINRCHLPRYIIILLDRDIIEFAEHFDDGVSDIIKVGVNWLLRSITVNIETQRKTCS